MKIKNIKSWYKHNVLNKIEFSVLHKPLKLQVNANI